MVFLLYTYIYYIPPPLTVHFSMTRSVRYQPIFNTLYYTLHTEHAYCLSYRFLNNVLITTVIEMVELVEILDRRLGKRSVEQVRYVINNLLHLVIVKYGDISLVLCISTRLRLVTILSLLVKYLVIFHADPCNKSYIYMDTTVDHFTPLALRVRGNNIGRGRSSFLRRKNIQLLIGERSEPLSRVFNDQPRDIYIYGGVRTYVQNASCYFSKLKLCSPTIVRTYVTLAL